MGVEPESLYMSPMPPGATPLLLSLLPLLEPIHSLIPRHSFFILLASLPQDSFVSLPTSYTSNSSLYSINVLSPSAPPPCLVSYLPASSFSFFHLLFHPLCPTQISPKLSSLRGRAEQRNCYWFPVSLHTWLDCWLVLSIARRRRWLN